MLGGAGVFAAGLDFGLACIAAWSVKALFLVNPAKFYSSAALETV
jgi:hypothetical protein